MDALEPPRVQETARFHHGLQRKSEMGGSSPNTDAENVIEYNFFLKWPGFR
jgi:hypothetical protein